jgi:cysteinyl-tRNA synthetase
MSRKYLGPTFDMHGGGQDLIFPHHENEIAQSVGANGQPFAKLWMHHGFVTVKEEKMSKSLGNFLTIREVLKLWPAEVLRLFLFSTQYRNPLDYNDTALHDAETGLERMYACLAQVDALPEPVSRASESLLSQKDRKTISTLRDRFAAAMDNDFNTAQALGHLFDAVKALNKAARLLLKQAGSTEDAALVRQGAADLRELAGLLGLLGQDAAEYLQAKKAQMLAQTDLTEARINALIEQRKEARKRKDWAAGDAVRDELLAHKIELQDGPDGTAWSVKNA